MGATYKATGIVLKGMAFGESDRILTILTPEKGLIRAIAPGARKYKSSLRGRCELFVVNNLLLVQGKSLDKIIQAETIESYPKLSRSLAKLSVGQYLAEMVLTLALDDQPQGEIYQILLEHLGRLERVEASENILGYFCQSIFHILAVAGIAPRVQECVITGKAVETGDSGFSFEAGGIINFSAITEGTTLPKIDRKLSLDELHLLQQLGERELTTVEKETGELAWINLDRLLRDYTRYHLGKTFRSSALVDGLSPLEF